MRGRRRGDALVCVFSSVELAFGGEGSTMAHGVPDTDDLIGRITGLREQS
jgi:hypothetical protein